MDFKYIEQLLERYWQCETSLEEEAQLRTFFTEEDVPEHLSRYKDLFVYQQLQQEEHLGADFDARVLAEIEAPVVKARRMTLTARFMPLFNLLPCPEEVHFHLFLCQTQDNRNLLVALTFHIPQLHNQPLLFGKFIYQAVYQSHSFFIHQPFVRTRCFGSLFHIGGKFHRSGVFPFAAVYRQIPCHCQAIGFDRTELRPLVALVPYPNQRFLHNILRFRPVGCNPQGQPKELVFQRENVITKTDFLHL